MQFFFSKKVFILSRKSSEMLNSNKILCFLPEVSSIGGYTFIPSLDSWERTTLHHPSMESISWQHCPSSASRSVLCLLPF